MRTGKIFVLVFLFIVVKSFSQTKVLTIEDAFTNRALYPKSMDQLQWIASR